MRRALCAVAFAVLLGGSGVARADDPREASRAAFRKGVDDLKRGDYPNARAAFLDAYRLYPHPSILLNLGLARAKTSEWVDAERDLARFLAEDTGATQEELAAARATLVDVRHHLGTLRVRVSPAQATATVDGKAVALLPGSFVDVRVVEGAHVVSARAPEHRSLEQRILAQPERVQDVDIRLEAASHDTTAPSASPPMRQTFGWALLGVSAVATGVGVWSGLRAQSLADDYNTPGRSRFQDPETRSSGVAHRTGADIAFGIAIVSALGGAFLLIDPFGPRGAHLHLGPTYAGAGGSF